MCSTFLYTKRFITYFFMGGNLRLCMLKHVFILFLYMENDLFARLKSFFLESLNILFFDTTSKLITDHSCK